MGGDLSHPGCAEGVYGLGNSNVCDMATIKRISVIATTQMPTTFTQKHTKPMLITRVTRTSP